MRLFTKKAEREQEKASDFNAGAGNGHSLRTHSVTESLQKNTQRKKHSPQQRSPSDQRLPLRTE